MKRLKTLRNLFLLMLGAGFLLSAASSIASAQEAKPGCNPEMMDAMEAKAWMLAQRRIAQNQNLIEKPDSVIEYSCFNQHIGWLADNPGRRFSEIEDYPTWTEIQGLGKGALDYALYETVTAPMLVYLGSFGHTFRGGRMEDAGGSPPAYGQYNCIAMQKIWLEARCMNFIDKEDKDRGARDSFYDFRWYANNDPRVFPPEYEVCEKDDRFEPAMKAAYNEDQDLFVLPDENDPNENEGLFNDGAKYDEDLMLAQEILDFVLPGEDCSKSAKVPTGLKVAIPPINDSNQAYDDTICTMPGCSYSSDSKECVK